LEDVLKIEIIPAIDIIGGECVRLSQGDYSSRKVYSSNPLETARRFEDSGVRRLHLVDLDGAKARTVVNLKVLESISAGTGLIIDFGGGVQSDGDLRSAFDAGADKITAGSISVRDPEKVAEWLLNYGPDRIIIGADVKDGRIAVNAWTRDSGLDLMDFLRSWTGKNMAECICTDVAMDGMLSGPSTDLYRDILDRFPDLYLTASGGISGMRDILDLQSAGIPAVIVGKAFYEGRITMEDLGE